MKELSIEEKAKLYDEIVERAKIEKEKSRNLGLLEFIENNFPQLKENEDERIRKHLISFFDNLVTFGNASICETEDTKVDDILAWLEKQSESTEWKQEWSEEDENIKESIITGLEMLKDGASDKSLIALYNKKIKWLKSIRPQSQWKPSEEQMKVLRYLDNGTPLNDFNKRVLHVLIDQLKKLMEE